MRFAYDRVRALGVVPIEEIRLNPKSRDDDIPRILMALKELWMYQPLRNNILSILEEQIGATANQTVGRPGMDYWRICVLSVLKQGLGCDDD